VNVAKRISPRTAGQARYVQSIREHDITFAVGPAGTGKTYLAVAVVRLTDQDVVRHPLVGRMLSVL